MLNKLGSFLCFGFDKGYSSMSGNLAQQLNLDCKIDWITMHHIDRKQRSRYKHVYRGRCPRVDCVSALLSSDLVKFHPCNKCHFISFLYLDSGQIDHL